MAYSATALLNRAGFRGQVAGEATAQELFLGKVLVIFPLTLVIAIDLVFYIAAFRERLEDGAYSLRL